jgi:hypothetical protein
MPYSECRLRLRAFLDGGASSSPLPRSPAFDDGTALFRAVCNQAPSLGLCETLEPARGYPTPGGTGVGLRLAIAGSGFGIDLAAPRPHSDHTSRGRITAGLASRPLKRLAVAGQKPAWTGAKGGPTAHLTAVYL